MQIRRLRGRAAPFLFLVLAACAHGPRPGAAPAGPPARLTVQEYLALLPPPPLVVGLDVDDTALFSTPAFLYAKGRLAPEAPAPGDPARELQAWRGWAATLEARRDALFARVIAGGEGLTPSERDQRARFWEDVNGPGDAFSPPKAAARAIVRHHLARGDEVHFVTARPRTEGERLTAKLRADFGDERLQVEFTDQRPKAQVLRQRGVVIYYGDADGDMVDARAAGASGVRFLRSPASSNDTPTQPGLREEWVVLVDSEL